MNLYIDTNIFLTFYHLSNDDLDELKKLALLIENGDIVLYIPEQTKNEFRRNREKKINEAITTLKDQKISSKFPQIAKGYDEFTKLIEAHKEYEKLKNIIITKIKSDSQDSNLNADLLIDRILNSATHVPINSDLVDKAKLRFDLGNPPGKGKSYGDALNWEVLLENVPNNEELNLISEDNDYVSILDTSKLNDYLKQEWKNKKNSEVVFFKSLSDFLRKKFKNITLSDEFEKELMIQRLATSGSFSDAKFNLTKLTKFSEFSIKQLNDIIEIATENTQLFWIYSDIGVGDVLYKMIEGNEEKLDPKLFEKFKEMYPLGVYDVVVEQDDLPF